MIPTRITDYDTIMSLAGRSLFTIRDDAKLLWPSWWVPRKINYICPYTYTI